MRRHCRPSTCTGLDIRKFDDALTFKIALMVESYLHYLDNTAS